MDRRLVLSIIILLASVLLLAGLMNFQAGSAEELPDSDNSGPTMEEPEIVTQKAVLTPGTTTEVATSNNSGKPAPAAFGGTTPMKTTTLSVSTSGQSTASVEVIANFSLVTKTNSLNVTFIDNSENASSLYWDFGDGYTNTSECGVTLYHEYSSFDKEYSVNLTAYNGTVSSSLTQNIVLLSDDGESDDDSTTSVEVVANFSLVAKTNSLNVTFIDNSENASSLYWDFGDGNTSLSECGVTLYHEYSSFDKEYSVNLTAYNGTVSSSLIKNIVLLSDDGESDDDGTEGVSKEYPSQDIPEFPTIAIPMVAIIGMAFFFGRKQ